jgi:hypothetical protein
MSAPSTIYASDLKGYCPLNVCWQYILDVSQQLSKVATDTLQPVVALNNVEIQQDKFILTNATTKTDAVANVWLLAASAIELINGSPIFNGQGEKAQKATSPIPQLPQEEAKSLNILLHRCLNFDKSQRPGFAEIAKIAQQESDKLSHQQRQCRASHCVTDKQKQNEIDSKWPESMIANIRNVITSLLLALSLITVNAQNFLQEHNEAETQALVNDILLLRNNNEKSWNLAQDNLGAHIQEITLMTKLIDRNNDCLLSGKQRFFINIIVNELKRKGRVQFSSKEFLDGPENHAPFSIIEKGIKKGATSTYTIKNRIGQQCFAIIPFNASQAYSTELRIGNGPVISPSTKDAKGITYYILDANQGPKDGENITLKISNQDKVSNATFVIVNHNPKSK